MGLSDEKEVEKEYYSNTVFTEKAALGVGMDSLENNKKNAASSAAAEREKQTNDQAHHADQQQQKKEEKKDGRVRRRRRRRNFLLRRLSCVRLEDEIPTVDEPTGDGGLNMQAVSRTDGSPPTHLVVMVNGIIGRSLLSFHHHALLQIILIIILSCVSFLFCFFVWNLLECSTTLIKVIL